MRIDRKLNLVIPIDRGDESKLWVHVTPIRKEIFEAYHLVLAKTFSAFAQNGLDPRSAPSVGALILKSIAQGTQRDNDAGNWWDGDDGVGGRAGLLAEIVRMSNCLVGTDKGLQMTPLQEALDKSMVTDEEKAEVMNLLVFFTAASLIAPRNDRPILVRGMAAVYNLESTYSNFTEWSTSLRTQMQKENTGEKPNTSSETSSDT
jgi:hypothetical protein